MVSIHTIFGIVFVLGMTVFLYLRRSSLVVQKVLGRVVYFAMLRTKWGLRGMNAVAKSAPRFLRGLFYTGVVVGFLGMVFISYEIIKSSFLLFAYPELAPGIQPVLPIAVKGVFFVPFVYWIVSIFVIAAIHEFSHGVAARVYNIPVKSSGFAFLGVILPIIPAAFVEPDEQKLVKRPRWHQLGVFAAGPWSNVIMAFLIIFLLGFPFPGVSAETSDKLAIVNLPEFANSLTQWEGLKVTGVTPDSPAAEAGVTPGLVITHIDGVSVTERQALLARLDTIRPGDKITMTINGITKPIVVGAHPDDATKPLIGVQFEALTAPTPAAKAAYGETGVQAMLGGITLLVFLYALSLGIGLFNLLPLGPIDGGRMFRLAAEGLMGKRAGHVTWKYLGFFFLGLIIVNLTVGFVR